MTTIILEIKCGPLRTYYQTEKSMGHIIAAYDKHVDKKRGFLNALIDEIGAAFVTNTALYNKPITEREILNRRGREVIKVQYMDMIGIVVEDFISGAPEGWVVFAAGRIKEHLKLLANHALIQVGADYFIVEPQEVVDRLNASLIRESGDPYRAVYGLKRYNLVSGEGFTPYRRRRVRYEGGEFKEVRKFLKER